jgi:hypothetical protein
MQGLFSQGTDGGVLICKKASSLILVLTKNYNYYPEFKLSYALLTSKSNKLWDALYSPYKSTLKSGEPLFSLT